MTNGKKRPGSDIDIDFVRQLAEVLVSSELTEIECAGDDWRVRLAKQPAGTPLTLTAPAAGSGLAHIPVTAGLGGPGDAEAGAKAEADAFAGHPGLLTSPMVGIVFTSPEPSAPPFVSVGDTVAVGDTVLLIEAMKVFNPIKAHRAGRIERMFVSSGMPVEYGESLLLIV